MALDILAYNVIPELSISPFLQQRLQNKRPQFFMVLLCEW